nr:MAG TPA: hypothetical protein [Caudoviricetes sp.]
MFFCPPIRPRWRPHGLGKRNPLNVLSENSRSMRNSGNKIQQNI